MHAEVKCRCMCIFNCFVKCFHMQLPDQFCEVIISSISKRSNSLLSNLHTIQTTLLEIIALCSVGGEECTLGLIATALQMTAPPPTHTSATLTNSSESSKRALHSKEHSGVLSTRNASAATLLGGQSRPLAPLLSKLGTVEETVLGNFCELVFETIGKMVERSHEQLCSCLWRSSELEPNSDNGELDSNTVVSKPSKTKSKIVSFDIPDSPTKGNSAIELENELINSISQTILLPDRSKTTPPLQLEVEVHFLIPRICLKPNLDDIQSYLSRVSVAMTSVLHQVVCWAGPNAGFPLYHVLEAKGIMQLFHERITQAMQGTYDFSNSYKCSLVTVSHALFVLAYVFHEAAVAYVGSL